MRFVAAILTFIILAAAATADDFAVPLDPFDAFTAAAKPLLPAGLQENAKLWRQIAPSLRWLLHDHAACLQGLPAERQRLVVGEAARFILEARKERARDPVIGPGRPITALLDPNKGLEPKQITALATAYGTEAEVFKQSEGRSIEEVAQAFLAAIGDRAALATPATVVVVGHGLPKEIQSYSIPVERVAEALVGGAARRHAQGAPLGIDLGNLTLVFDDCFSADFCLNLARCIRQQAADRGAALVSLPVLIAGANRDRYGIVNIGEKFVTHFWDTVIELYFVRKPHPPAVTLGHFFGTIDNSMYGYGRTPIFDGTRIVDYKLVQPELVQDPVCFLPLTANEVAELRRILGLEGEGPGGRDVLPLLDAG